MNVQILEIPIEELEPSRFSEFGRVLAADRPADEFAAQPNRMIEFDFAVEGTPALYLIRYKARNTTFSEFERHLTMTETRIALGAAAVLVVAGSTAPEAVDRWPDPESVRAFMIRKGTGVLLRKGTWHAQCFPVAAEYADFAFLSELEAEQELVKPNHAFERTEMIDFADRGWAFSLTDPEGLVTGPS